MILLLLFFIRQELFNEYGSSAGIMFRFFCLQVPWNSNVDFSHDRMIDASRLIEKFKSFILNINQAVKKIDQRSKMLDTSQVCYVFIRKLESFIRLISLRLLLSYVVIIRIFRKGNGLLATFHSGSL